MGRTKAKLYAQKIEDKKMELENPDAYREFQENALPGRYTIEIERTKKAKTTKQCAVIFGLMIEQALHQMEEQTIGVEELMRYLLANDIPKGQKVTRDYLHQLMYIICPTTNERGDRLTLSKMDTTQASSLFERFRTILAPLGVVIDDPNMDR